MAHSATTNLSPRVFRHGLFTPPRHPLAVRIIRGVLRAYMSFAVRTVVAIFRLRPPTHPVPIAVGASDPVIVARRVTRQVADRSHGAIIITTKLRFYSDAFHIVRLLRRAREFPLPLHDHLLHLPVPPIHRIFPLLLCVYAHLFATSPTTKEFELPTISSQPYTPAHPYLIRDEMLLPLSNELRRVYLVVSVQGRN